MAAILYLVLLILVVPQLFIVTVDSNVYSFFATPEVLDEYKRPGEASRIRTKKRLKHPERLWKRAVVIYKLKEWELGCPYSKRCSTLMRAMHEVSANTCVRFKEWTGERDYVIFTKAPEDSEFVAKSDSEGRKGGEQTVQIQPQYWHSYVVLHEVGHVLGLYHELSRPDRDEHVKMKYENISPDKNLDNWKKYDLEEVNLLGKPFDPDSIMMYTGDGGSKKKGILGVLNPTYTFGMGITKAFPNKKLSNGDIRMINDLYRCNGNRQKPAFPFDYVCDFKKDSCGLKWMRAGTWRWLESSAELGAGYSLVSSLKANRCESSDDWNVVWTVNFHGLSPLDKVRGPEGCIKFKCLFGTRDRRPVFLELIMVNLMNPLDQKLDPKQTRQIWSDSSTANRGIWTWVSIRIDVLRPFKLKFVSTFGDSSSNTVEIGSFEMKYSVCSEDSAAVDGRQPTATAMRGNEPSLSTRRSFARFWKTPSGSLSRSFSRSLSRLLFRKSASNRSTSRSRSNSFSESMRKPNLYNGRFAPDV